MSQNTTQERAVTQGRQTKLDLLNTWPLKADRIKTILYWDEPTVGREKMLRTKATGASGRAEDQTVTFNIDILVINANSTL